MAVARMTGHQTLTMTSRASLWGRRLPDYSVSYDTVGAIRTPFLSVEEQVSLRIDALSSIHSICRLVGNRKGSNLEATADRIPLSTLQSVLKLAYSPHTFRDFAFPPLISACIKLMTTIKLSGKPAPFSFEYGYLCYRIVSLALGVCLLRRTNELDTAVADMVSDPGTTPLQVLSEHVSRTLCKVIESSPDNRHCDYILGWSQLEKLPNQKPLVTRSDASMLLGLLSEDRKHFLQSFMLTYPPVLSGVFFLIWRNWCFERAAYSGKGTAALTKFVSPFFDLLYRGCLIVTTDQERSFAAIHNATTDDAHLWKEKFIDVEDCRNLVQALNNRLVRGEEGFLFDPLDPMVIPTLLGFLTPYVGRGAKDLYPALLGSTLDRLWDVLIYKADSQPGTTVDIMRKIFESLGKMLKSIEPVPPKVGPQIIDTVIENDLLGLTARAMTVLKPIVKESSLGEISRNVSFIEEASKFFQALCSQAPPPVIKSKFFDSLREWLKYLMYFFRLLVTASDGERNHWALCVDYLHRVNDTWGLKNQPGPLGLAKPCTYARCPDPFMMTGAQFACSECLVIYCSERCQAADWIHDHCQTPHRELCELNSTDSE